MINKDSIVTAYDEHLTLVEWLQKVEKALDNAVLTNLGIAKLSDQGNIATYQVTATFADNTTIVSNTFTLPSTNIVTAFSNLTTLVNGFDTRITDNTNNITRALFTPSSAPTTRKVVTIDTNGTQDNVDSTSLTTLMSNIVDSHGNARFVEGNISLSSEIATDFNLEYGKWSLSGTHLMIVLAVKCTADNIKYAGAWFNNGTSLPNYIFDKIKTSSVVVAGAMKDLVSINQPLTIRNSDIINGPKFYLQKSNGRFQIISFDPFTYSTNDYLRIQFDLLIDSE